MKLTAKNWICGWGLAGLVVPAVLLLRWYFFDHSFGEVELILWPSSFILMTLEGPPERLTIVVMYTIAIAANVLLYSIVGLLGWMLLAPILRPHTEKG